MACLVEVARRSLAATWLRLQLRLLRATSPPLPRLQLSTQVSYQISRNPSQCFLSAAPEEAVVAADEVDNSYLARVAAAAELDNAYLAPVEDYSADYSAPEADSSYLAPAPSDEVPVYEEEALDNYEEPLDNYEEPLDGYNDELDAAASDAEASDPLKMLMNAVPGVPGEDYPIYAETPETAFSCDGQVDGGYYADEEAQCQVFHICTADGAGGLAKYSFLCPNGTIFNQNYFICDWWFNVDCAESAAIAEAKNSEVAGAREAATAAAADAGQFKIFKEIF